MRRKVYVLLFLIPLVLMGILLFQSRRRELVLSTLPWVEQGLRVTARYDKDNLYAYIDGAQDKYVQGGCMDLTIWEKDENGHHFSLEVYRFVSPKKAQAMLAQEGGTYEDDGNLITTYQNFLIKCSITPPSKPLVENWKNILQEGKP